jgi:hypothetical protein
MRAKGKKYSLDDHFNVKPSTKLKRLTRGEFDTTDYALSRFGAQQLFLRTIKVLMPEVLDDLRNDCYQVYLATKLPEYHWRVMPNVWVDIYNNQISDGEQFLLPLRESIWSWSKRWNLDTDWCRARIFFTLVTWATPRTAYTYSKEEGEKIIEITDKCEDWSYGEMYWGDANINIEEFIFKSIWNPLYMSRSGVDRTTRAYFEKEWTEYLDKIEERFYQKNDARRSLYSPKQEHFNWLVKYQIKCMSAELIFAEENPKIYASRKKEGGISEHTKFIRKAYNKLANFIYLPLRPSGITPGRRPRKKT